MGRLISERLNRRFMLVGRWVHNLSGRMKWWMVQSLERRLRVRMLNQMFKMMVRRMLILIVLMDNNSR